MTCEHASSDRFSYKTKEPWKGSPRTTTYRYYCSQNIKEKQEAKDEPGKICGHMDRFDCSGNLSIVVNEADARYSTIRYVHHLAHKHYVNINLNPAAVKYLSDHKTRRPGELFNDLRRDSEDGAIQFTQKQVHRRWREENATIWRLDQQDELNSANLILGVHAGRDIEVFPFADEAGVSAIAFAIKHVLHSRGTAIHEIGMDSTCK